MSYCICLRVAHTGTTPTSILIADIEDGTGEKPDLIKSGPVYVPPPPSSPIELTFTGAVSKSYQAGNIRKFIETGHLTAEFRFYGSPQQAATGFRQVTDAVYTAAVWDRTLFVCTAGAVTIQLPEIADHQTKTVEIFDARGTASVANITVLPAAGETIGGAPNAVIAIDHGFLNLRADCSTDWLDLTSSTDHASLTNLAWTASGHTGTPSRLAAFDGAGAADEISTTVTGDVAGTLPGPLTVEDLTIAGEVQGSVLYFDGANWVHLPPGTEGERLTTQGAAADPVWQPAASPDEGEVILLRNGTPAQLFSTIGGALAVAVAGDVIRIGVGEYPESITVPDEVILQGSCSCRTRITGAAPTGTRVTLQGGGLIDLQVGSPTDAAWAVDCTTATRANLANITIVGTGALGRGIRMSGAGIMVCAQLFYLTGVASNFLEITAGLSQVTGIDVVDGTLTDAFLVSGGEVEAHGFEVSSLASVTDSLEVGAGTIRGSGGFLAGVNALHITNNNADVQMLAVRLNGSTYDLLVDPGLTAGVCHLTSVEMTANKISIPGSWEPSDHVFTFQDETPGDPSLRVWGELHVGHAESGSESVFGEGDSYVRGLVAFTTDDTAGPVSDGANFVDVSTDLMEIDDGATATFQGVAADHTILVGSRLEDSLGNPLKHWGWKVNVVTAAVEVAAKSFAFEIWDGASWTEIPVMATDSSDFTRYSNYVLIRINNEHIRFGITADTTWAAKTINGVNAYWVRVRITQAVTTTPVFDQVKLSTNRSEINEDGTNTYHGNARFKRTVLATGNVFGETGGVLDATFTVGAGGLPTQWDHNLKNSVMNNDGDAVMTQLVLPRGLDTSLPLEVRTLQSFVGAKPTTTNVTMVFSLLALEVAGNPVADPTGGTTAIPRPLASTQTATSQPGLDDTISLALTADDNNRHRLLEFGPFDVSNYYEGDVLLVRLELDANGDPNQSAYVFSFEVVGSFWTNGEKL